MLTHLSSRRDGKCFPCEIDAAHEVGQSLVGTERNIARHAGGGLVPAAITGSL